MLGNEFQLKMYTLRMYLQRINEQICSLKTCHFQRSQDSGLCYCSLQHIWKLDLLELRGGVTIQYTTISDIVLNYILITSVITIVTYIYILYYQYYYKYNIYVFCTISIGLGIPVYISRNSIVYYIPVCHMVLGIPTI